MGSCAIRVDKSDKAPSEELREAGEDASSAVSSEDEQVKLEIVDDEDEGLLLPSLIIHEEQFLFSM